jgi:hypothetical protein
MTAASTGVSSTKATAKVTSNTDSVSPSRDRRASVKPVSAAQEAVPLVYEPTPSYDEQDDVANDYEEDYVVEDMAIRVVVRKRPISKIEIGRADKDCLEVLRRGKRG